MISFVLFTTIIRSNNALIQHVIDNNINDLLLIVYAFFVRKIVINYALLSFFTMITTFLLWERTRFPTIFNEI